MSLAKLVVHLQANYSGLTAGLTIARNHTAVAAQSINQSVATIKPAAVTELSVESASAATRVEQLAAAAHVLEKSLHSAAFAAHRVGQSSSILGGTIMHAAHTMHAATLVTSLLSTAFSVLMVPIRMIGAAAAIVFTGLLWALNTVLWPLRLLWNGLMLAVQAVWAFLKPTGAVVLAVSKIWFAFHGWIASTKMIFHWLSLLPPKVRLLVGGLLGLGLAGKAGAVAIRVLGAALSGLAFVARAAITGLQLLALPIIAILNPAAAARIVVQMLAGAVAFAGRMAMRASIAFLQVATSLVKLATAGLSRAISSFRSLGASMFGAAKTATIYGTIAASIWGVKLATAAETSRVVFGTMLHDMAQGKALLDQMQGSSVAPFFDAKAIQDAGRDLLKAKVPVDQITSRMEQLGGIALATKTPIEDLSRIYRQGMAKGAFQTDLVNQLASRGIDIYAALTTVTGKSGQALAEMMSKGEIGAAEMNAAIDHMTLGHGIYAGVVDNVAKTTAGMWSTSVNNISMAFQTMFGVAVEGNNGLMASIVSVTEQVKQRAASIGPVILQLSQMIIGIFRGLQAIIGTVWATVFGQTQTTFAGMLATTMEWVTKFRWFFENIVPVVQFVGLMMLLTLVSVFNDIAYWFTTKLPAYLDWFANNWKAVFRDLAVGTMTVFTNLAANIKNAMGVIWAFIKSGGTSGLEFTWTPLLDGFKSTVAQLPDIPDRAMTALESGLQEQMQTIGTNLADSFDKMMAEANASMAAAASTSPPVPLQSTPAGGGGEENESFGESKNKSDNSPLMKGSREAQAAIYAAIAQGQSQKDKAAQKAAEIAKKQLEEAQKLNLRLAMAGNIAVIESLEG